MARRGARQVIDAASAGPSASELWRDAVDRADRDKGTRTGWKPEERWTEEPADEDVPPALASKKQARGQVPVRSRDLATGREGVPAPGGHRRKVPRLVVDELAAAAGDARGAKLAHRLADASYAYEKERYQEARRILKPLVDEVPGSAAGRELHGLVLYRSGQWAAAARELEAFRQMTGSFDQHPVLADCYRALHRYEEAEQVWEDLRRASPNGDLVAEGRIVAAGCLADRGDLQGAISLLEKTARRVARPAERHLRQWYVLADLYERAGEIPRARELFGRVVRYDAEAFDVRSRLRALR